MPSKETVLSNWIFAGLKEIGAKPEENLYVWSQGLGFHHHNLLNGLAKNVEDESVRRAILTDIWKHFFSIGLERPNQVLGVTAEPDLNRLDETLLGIMNDREHPAILGMGEYVEEALYNWVRTFAVYDFSVYTYLEKHLGAKEALKIYMDMWESFALANVEHVKEALGIGGPEDVTMEKLGQVSKAYWEAIGCSYHPTIETEDVHEAELGDCAYWWNMREIMGEDKCRSMTLKTEAVVSVNYYDAILKALGVFDKYAFTMDKFQCCGDDHCRVRFERRK